jgi:hypothetical protein
MLRVFFAGERRLLLEAVPKGRKFNQDHFLQTVLPVFTSKKRRYCRKNRGAGFFVHMNNAMLHNGARIASIMDRKHLLRAPHPPHSPDTSPCDVWLLGAVKHTMKDIKFNFTSQIVNRVGKLWDLTFEDVQRVFEEWITRPGGSL